MLTREIIVKRLAHIKQLYKIGIEQSRQNESIAVFSLLAFHDSIEMFLKLLSEHKELNSEKYNFMDYWTGIPDLTLKESMRRLNARRVNLKHKGLIPAKSDIEISRVNTTDFFEQNTKPQFGVDFSEISLIVLISFPKVKKHLEVAQNALESNNFELSIEHSACAFEELLYTYESNKMHWGESPFFFGEDITFTSSFSPWRSSIESFSHEIDELSEFLEKIKKTIGQLQKAVKITSLGIDYKEYVMFKILTPIITRMTDGNVFSEIIGKKNWNKDNCQYCIDFVIKTSLKLQEFDFDIQTLDTTEFNIDVE